MSYTMYTPLNVWLDPASITDVVAYIQTYLSENDIYSEEEIEGLIHDYLVAHPELIGGVQSVNGKTGTVVLSASDINTANNVTIESVLASLSSQISSIAANVATNTANITSLTGRVSTAETDLSNLKSNLNNKIISINLSGMQDNILYPVDIPAGSTLTMSTFDDTTQDKNTTYFHFYDANKEFKVSYNFWLNLKSRTITLDSALGDIKYVALRVMPAIPTMLEKGNSKTSDANYIVPNNFISEIYPSLSTKWNNHIISIAHRGTEISAPENTMPAFLNAYMNGFEYIETDVRETSDNQYVLIHDETVNRTTNGTGNVADMTLAQLQSLDAGSWFSAYYAGTKIPTLQEFLLFCRAYGVKPVIEIKNVSSVSNLINYVKSYGFIGERVCYITANFDDGATISTADQNATIFFTASTIWANIVTQVNNLKNGKNHVYLSMERTAITQALINDCIANDLDLGAWTVTYTAHITALSPFVTAIISSGVHPGRALFTNYQTHEF